MNSAKPPAARVQEVTDTVHGVRIADPYRWLEDGSSNEVRAWVDGQNAWAEALLGARPGRAGVRERLGRLLAIGTIGTPDVRGDLYFFTRREGTQNQPILYVRQGLKGQDRVLVDPNPLSPDGTATIDWWFPSRDGKLLAYGISTAGDEKSTLRVRDTATGRDLPDVIPHTRYCSLGWVPDGSGFYYTRYPTPGSVPAGQENYNRRVFHHRLGDDPANDPLVFGADRKPEEIIEIDLSADGRWLTAVIYDGWARTDLFVSDRKAQSPTFTAVAQGLDAIFTGGVVHGILYVRTNFEAPRYRLLAIDPSKPGRDGWKTLIPQGAPVLDDARVVGGTIVARLMQQASSRVVLYDRDGRRLTEIPLPALGTVDSISGEPDGKEVFFGFSSYTVPPRVERIDLATKTASTWQKVTADVDLSRLEVKQVFYPSKDGTKVSMFVVGRKGLALDGSNPTLLYGYGGFNVSQTPGFSRSLVLWLERGGVYAEANLRGGGEYGEDWHRAGMLDRKQNVFDDYIAAAEWLIAKKYTRSDRLAIYGGSNGGLLVGAALTQRPDLFKAVVCAVPLLDMLRYQNFQIARLWVPEYGSAEDAAQFKYLYAYSPYHHVKKGTAYPATLLTTADSDSRVDPMHARKMAALLQASTSSDRPILLRTETRAGHGAGKPLSKQIDEAADVYGFLIWQLGLEMKRDLAPEPYPESGSNATKAGGDRS
ncbi:MAG TPA: prolyl oligopeptidase family serine peptidase [Candidatus Polarisedimenticolia bacterium]|nr:prolyl oligopeptidase family serine peptidase [Candidatus Polarisedimenticolia bacterium]